MDGRPARIARSNDRRSNWRKSFAFYSVIEKSFTSHITNSLRFVMRTVVCRIFSINSAFCEMIIRLNQRLKCIARSLQNSHNLRLPSPSRNPSDDNGTFH